MNIEEFINTFAGVAPFIQLGQTTYPTLTPEWVKVLHDIYPNEFEETPSPFLEVIISEQVFTAQPINIMYGLAATVLGMAYDLYCAKELGSPYILNGQMHCVLMPNSVAPALRAITKFKPELFPKYKVLTEYPVRDSLLGRSLIGSLFFNALNVDDYVQVIRRVQSRFATKDGFQGHVWLYAIESTNIVEPVDISLTNHITSMIGNETTYIYSHIGVELDAATH